MKIFQFAMGVLGFLAVMAVSYAYGYSYYSMAALVLMAVLLLINIMKSPKWSESLADKMQLVQAALALISLVCMLIDTLTVRVSLVNYISLFALLVYVVAEVVMRVRKKKA